MTSSARSSTSTPSRSTRCQPGPGPDPRRLHDELVMDHGGGDGGHCADRHLVLPDPAHLHPGDRPHRARRDDASDCHRSAAATSATSPARPARAAACAGTPVMAALGSAFNVLALNLVLLLVSLPVITLPLALNAATTALDRWRRGGRGPGGPRVLHRPAVRPARAGLRRLVGVPLAAIGVGVAEARYFLQSHHQRQRRLSPARLWPARAAWARPAWASGWPRC